MELIKFRKDIDVLGLYTFFYYEHNKDFYFAGERHDFWEMVYVDNGEISVVADNSAYTIRQGEVIFHKPMEFHTLASNKKDPHNVLVLTFAVKSRMMKFFENKIFTVDRQQKKILSFLLEEVNNSFGTVLDIQNSREVLNAENQIVGTQQLIINYLEQFLISLIRTNQSSKRSGRKSIHAKKDSENAMVLSIETYLSENVYYKITLGDVCKKFNLSKSAVCQIFKEATGKSIIDYYISLKIAEAKILIRAGDLNYTQISEKLCYTSIHHFTRIFKKSTGISPSNYEKSIK